VRRSSTPGELAEDAAAGRIAAALAGSGTRLERTHTGRTNLHAELDGLIVIDRDAIARANAIDEAITVATMPALSPGARAGEMVATVKIIPFGAREAAVDAAAEAVRGRDLDPGRGAAAAAAWWLTRFAETPQLLLDRATAAQRTPARALRAAGSTACSSLPHEIMAVAAAITRQARDGPRPDPGARRLGDHGPPRRHPGGRSRPRAARSSGSVCRSIRETS